ncbi:MAG TPA: hypothetical protein PKJ61_01270 [Propionicimonas sp.]|nr:hypothetical protein [Propionicimonas sp.]HQD98074.1 hypothetical protein [Propionicimonas sp.]
MEPDFMPVSARVAWTYVAALIAVVGAALLVVVGGQVVSGTVCKVVVDDSPDDFAISCLFWWGIWLAIGGFLVALVAAVRALKLDWWLALTLLAGAGLLVAVDAITAWWWWVLAALLPALAALASADWDRGPRFRRTQQVALLVLAGLSLAAVIWWYLG